MKGRLLVLICLMAGFLGAFAYHHLILKPELAGRDSSIGQYNAENEGFSLASQSADGAPAPASRPDFVLASSVSTPCVVFIKTVSGVQNNFDWFFFSNPGRQTGSGSGVIFSADGYIVTNNHVIEDAETIEVIHNKTTYKAILIGTDPGSDIAVIKI
jgi:S1-C subfamily serine protease